MSLEKDIISGLRKKKTLSKEDILNILEECPPNQYNYQSLDDMFPSDRRRVLLYREVNDLITLQNWKFIKKILLYNLYEKILPARGSIFMKQVELWEEYIVKDNIPAIRRHLTGMLNDDILMREAVPFFGVKLFLTEHSDTEEYVQQILDDIIDKNRPPEK